jgi:hypothetical protein
MNLAWIFWSQHAQEDAFMYRIEVAPGEEAVFRTIEELAVAIRNGVVTPRARIFHHASEKWLPIGLHPHYKKALEMPAANAPHAPVTTATPIPTPSRPKAHPPSRPKAHPPSHPKPHSVVHYPEPERWPEPRPIPEPSVVPKATAAPKIPAPVQSPVIAMQNEVLRDLPVISIPEPLPWMVKAAPAVAPPVEVRAPVVHAPVVHAPVVHAPVVHAPVVHAPVTRPPVTHPPVTHPPAKRSREPYRSLEYPPPPEERHETESGEPPLPRPTARRSRRMGGRPFLLLGAAASLVVGTHFVLTATPSASANPPAHPPEASASVAGDEAPDIAAEPPAPTATGAPRVTIAPARVRMTPGPAFAGSVPARSGADSAGTTKSTAPQPAPAPAAPAAPAIAPPPAGVELTLPDLTPGSVVPPPRTGDTMGMKKVLRALNGASPAEGSAAP